MSVDQAEAYMQQRIAWRRALPDLVVRELASDFLRGHKDEMYEDAYQEYLDRFSHQSKGPTGRPLHAKGNRSKRRERSLRDAPRRLP